MAPEEDNHAGALAVFSPILAELIGQAASALQAIHAGSRDDQCDSAELVLSASARFAAQYRRYLASEPKPCLELEPDDQQPGAYPAEVPPGALIRRAAVNLG